MGLSATHSYTLTYIILFNALARGVWAQNRESILRDYVACEIQHWYLITVVAESNDIKERGISKFILTTH